MRNKVFGAIGMVWGGLILLSRLLGSSGDEGSAAYQAGSLTGLVFGGLIFLAGLYTFLKKAPSQKP